MINFGALYGELIIAIKAHGRRVTFAPEVRDIIDRYDMVDFSEADGFIDFVQFGVRQGEDKILGSYRMTPQDEGGPAQVQWDIVWQVSVPSQLPSTEERHWSWDIDLDQAEFEYSILQ